VEVAEDFFGPEIDAALARIAMREFDDGDALRPEEEEERNQPEPDGDAAVGGDRGDDVEIEYRDDEEEDEVKASEDAFEVGLIGLSGVRRGVLRVSRFQSFKVSKFRVLRLSGHRVASQLPRNQNADSSLALAAPSAVTRGSE